MGRSGSRRPCQTWPPSSDSYLSERPSEMALFPIAGVGRTLQAQRRTDPRRPAPMVGFVAGPLNPPCSGAGTLFGEHLFAKGEGKEPMIASAYVSREIDLEPPLVSAMVLGWDGSRLVVSPSRPGRRSGPACCSTDSRNRPAGTHSRSPAVKGSYGSVFSQSASTSNVPCGRILNLRSDSGHRTSLAGRHCSLREGGSRRSGRARRVAHDRYPRPCLSSNSRTHAPGDLIGCCVTAPSNRSARGSSMAVDPLGDAGDHLGVNVLEHGVIGRR